MAAPIVLSALHCGKYLNCGFLLTCHVCSACGYDADKHPCFTGKLGCTLPVSVSCTWLVLVSVLCPQTSYSRLRLRSRGKFCAYSVLKRSNVRVYGFTVQMLKLPDIWFFVFSSRRQQWTCRWRCVRFVMTSSRVTR